MTDTLASMNGRDPLRRAAARRGFSLIEMVTVIAVASVLLGVIVSMLTALLDWERTTRWQAVARGEVERLSDVLRDDVRRATDVNCPADDRLVVVFSGDQRAVYRLDGTDCRRQVFDENDQAGDTQLFSVGLPATWQLEPATVDAAATDAEASPAAQSPVVTIQLSRLPRHDADPAPLPVVVSADLGADRLLVNASDGGPS